jgi:hypothetical protein
VEIRERDRRAAGNPRAEAAQGRAGGEEEKGYAYVVLDGTLIPIDRVAAGRPFYSGKHKKHGMNLQVIASPDGSILWVSGPLPGSVHDKKAEWIWGVLAELEAAGLIVLAGTGYQGAAHAKVPYKGKNKPESQKDANRAHAKRRAPGERANAQLKNCSRTAQELAHPTEAPLLPLARRPARQGHPHPGNSRGIRRMEKVHCTFSKAAAPVLHLCRLTETRRAESAGSSAR